MAVFEVPVQSRPQTFTITLARQSYRCRLQWNVPADCWVLDFDDQYGEPILHGVPLVTGTDLLDGFEYLGFNGAMLVVTTASDTDMPPGRWDLGERGHLYFLSWEQ